MQNRTDIQLSINGESRSVPDGVTIADLLDELSIDRAARGIAVAVNDDVVRRNDWGSTKLDPNDRIEIIKATQGG